MFEEEEAASPLLILKGSVPDVLHLQVPIKIRAFAATLFTQLFDYIV